MRIGIVGAGNIGSALTRRLTTLGHDVSVANSRGPQTLRDLAAESGATAVEASQAAQGADLVVVTVPQARVPDLPAGLLEGANDGLVVVDTGNYYPARDGRIAAIEEGTTESRWVEQQLGHPVIKAFNTIVADHLEHGGRPPRSDGRIALPVAGDVQDAKAIVLDLVEALGFDAVDAGDLDDSWRQQPGTPVYAADRDAAGLRAGLEEASRERSPRFRADGAG